MALNWPMPRHTKTWLLFVFTVCLLTWSMHCQQKRRQRNNFLNKNNISCKVVLLQNDMGLPFNKRKRKKKKPYKPLEDGWRQILATKVLLISDREFVCLFFFFFGGLFEYNRDGWKIDRKSMIENLVTKLSRIISFIHSRFFYKVERTLWLCDKDLVLSVSCHQRSEIFGTRCQEVPSM
jgi:hypothetical protein